MFQTAKSLEMFWRFVETMITNIDYGLYIEVISTLTFSVVVEKKYLNLLKLGAHCGCDYSIRFIRLIFDWFF